LTTEYREYSEEKQRGQRRGGPARYVTNFSDGTLTSSSSSPGVLRMTDTSADPILAIVIPSNE